MKTYKFLALVLSPLFIAACASAPPIALVAPVAPGATVAADPTIEDGARTAGGERRTSPRVAAPPVEEAVDEKAVLAASSVPLAKPAAALARLANASPAVEAPQAGWRPRMGATLDEATAGEFFRFFNLRETSRGDVGGGRTMVVFLQGEGAMYPGMLFAEVTIDTRGRIVETGIIVARPFIDSLNTLPFAEDFTRSFLRVAVTASELASADDVIRAMRAPDKAPAAAKMPTPIARAFFGARAEVAAQLDETNISFSNRTLQGAPVLSIVVRPKKP